MNIKKSMLCIIIILILGILCIAIFNGASSQTNDNGKIKIVVSNFASYDFLRAIIGENDNIVLNFLLGPGKEAHSYEPTASELIQIQNSDMFVYVGGEMEKWSDKVLDALETNNTKIICISDFVETMSEKEVDGAEEESEEEEDEYKGGAFDEHIWTSPENAIKMINALETAMEEIDSDNINIFKENSENYIAQIKDVDKKIQNIVDNRVRNRLIFGDKMPMQYFMDYYNLEVSAAFNGCSTETEPATSTVTYLINKAKDEKIPVILYIELSTGKVANTIAKEVGQDCTAMQIQTLHNVSLDDFNNGETWVSLMLRNVDVLKKALQ